MPRIKLVLDMSKFVVSFHFSFNAAMSCQLLLLQYLVGNCPRCPLDTESRLFSPLLVNCSLSTKIIWKHKDTRWKVLTRRYWFWMSLNTTFKTDKVYEKPQWFKPREKPCTTKLNLTPSVFNVNNINQHKWINFLKY